MRMGIALSALAITAGCDTILRLDPIKPLPPIVSYRKLIAITNTTGAMLTDEPVSIALAQDMDIMAHALPDGSDLAFDDGVNPLAYEIVELDAGTGALDAWVRVPALAAGTTTIYLSYGSGAAAPPHDPTATWPDVFVGVWHLSGSSATLRDSTRHGHDLVATISTPLAIPGVAGSARSYVGSMTQKTCGGDSDNSLAFGTSSFTYSFWTYVDGIDTSSHVAMSKGGSSQTTAGFDVELSSAEWRGYISDGVTSKFVQPSTVTPLSAWSGIAIEVDRATPELRAYFDGSLADTTMLPALASLNASEKMCLGGEDSGASQFTGRIDEARVVATLLSPEQIRFEQLNLDPSTRDSVIAVGAEQAITSPP